MYSTQRRREIRGVRRLRVDGDCDDNYEKENYGDDGDLPSEVVFKSSATCEARGFDARCHSTALGTDAAARGGVTLTRGAYLSGRGRFAVGAEASGNIGQIYGHNRW